MKILFVWDSVEYLRFYDSALEDCAARGHDVAVAQGLRGIMDFVRYPHPRFATATSVRAVGRQAAARTALNSSDRERHGLHRNAWVKSHRSGQQVTASQGHREWWCSL